MGLRVPGCHIPVTVPEACGSTGENQPSLSGCPLSVPAELGPPSPTRAEPGRGGSAGSMSEDLCPGVQVPGISISGDHSLQGVGRSSSRLGRCRSPHRPLELPTPQTRMCTRGWQWIRLWSSGFTRLMASFFRIISMFWPCQEQSSQRSDKSGCHRKQLLLVHRLNPLGSQITHLTPGTIWGLATVAGLSQLLDTVIDCNTTLPWCQVFFRHLHPAQRSDCKALTSWGKRQE